MLWKVPILPRRQFIQVGSLWRGSKTPRSDGNLKFIVSYAHVFYVLTPSSRYSQIVFDSNPCNMCLKEPKKAPDLS